MVTDFARRLVHERQLAYISASAVSRCGVDQFGSLVPVVEACYRAHAERDVTLTKAEYLKYAGRSSYDRIIPLLGYLGGSFQVAGLKEICSDVSNHQAKFPRASGLVILNDPHTNRPFAILEASLISAARTAAVSGLALLELTTQEMSSVAVIGAGQLGQAHVRMISELFGPERFELRLFDLDFRRAESLRALADSLGLKAKTVNSAQEAIEAADVIVPATTEEQSYIEASWLKAKSVYCAVSLLDAKLDVYRSADLVIVDDLVQCMQEGRPLHILEQAGELPEQIVEIGAFLQARSRNACSGRLVFNPMGTVITDLAVASMIFDRAAETGDFIRLDV